MSFFISVIDPLNISSGGFFNWLTIMWLILAWLIVMFISFSVFYFTRSLNGEAFDEDSDPGFWDMDIKDLNEFFKNGNEEDLFERKSIRFNNL